MPGKILLEGGPGAGRDTARTRRKDVLNLGAQIAHAREAKDGLQHSTDGVRKAVVAHEKTVLDLAAVESASQDSRATMLTTRAGV